MNLLEEAIKSHNLPLVADLLTGDPMMIDLAADEGCHMALLAARDGSFDIVRYIVEYSRASMNIYDDSHRSILHYGVQSGDLDIVRYLTERVGMNPLEGDLELITPFDIACGLPNREIYEYFKRYIGAGIEDMYRNPIRCGMFPDPSIVRVNDDYYMVNSTFIYFPCIPVSHSKDLINWEIIGYAITNPDWAALDELEGGRGYWAPDISFHDGRFYITATYRLNDTAGVYRKQIIVSSDKPEGPYCKPSIIDEDGIDPSIFVDDDGRKYMLLNRGARIFELNKECTRQISKATLLYYGDYKRAPEGPHLLKKDGFYYLFEAEGGTGLGHRITVSRSKELFGPYKPCPYNPIMRQNLDDAPIVRCGHGKPVMTAQGQWYMVYLCGRMYQGKYSILGRETALDPITWTPDGWPIVNNLDGPGTLNIRPAVDVQSLAHASGAGACLKHNLSHELSCGTDGTGGGFLYDDFDGDSPKLYWMYPRPPHAGAFSLSDKKLCITGSSFDMDNTACRSIIVQRQRHFAFECDTCLTVNTIRNGQDVGLTCYYDENTWLKFGLFASSGRVCVKVVEHILNDTVEAASCEILCDSRHNADESYKCLHDEAGDADAGIASCEAQYTADKDKLTVYLRINTHYLKRSFSVSFDGRNYREVCVLDNVYYLCDEGVKCGKRFTGAMIGMYAHSGNEKPVRAYFDFFKYSKEDLNIEN